MNKRRSSLPNIDAARSTPLTESVFNKATEGDWSALQAIPKTDLHAHAELSCPFAVFSELSNNLIPPPPDKFDKFDGFFQYLSTYFFSIFDGASFPWDIYRQAFTHMCKDGIVYTEMSFDVYMVWNGNVNWREFSKRLNSISTLFNGKLHIGYELGIPKDGDPAFCLESLGEALELELFSSVDFYSAVKDGKLSDFLPCVKLIRDAGLLLKIHTGESESILQTKRELEFFEPDVVQHGTRCVEDPELLSMLQKMKQVNVCPASNLHLSLYESYSDHPIRKMFDANIPITIGTDDYAIFGKSISEQYVDLLRFNIFSVAELEQIRLNGFKLIKSDN